MSEIYHHGIKGQKWGVRRFQNADGTWTNDVNDFLANFIGVEIHRGTTVVSI